MSPEGSVCAEPRHLTILLPGEKCSPMDNVWSPRPPRWPSEEDWAELQDKGASQPQRKPQFAKTKLIFF